MKILLICEDERVGRLLRRALQRQGHAVLLAADDLAIQQMLQRRPDLILVQPDLIEIDGRPLLEAGLKGPFPLVMPFPALVQPATEGEDEEVTLREKYRRLARTVTRRLRRLGKGEAARLKIGHLVIQFEEKRVLFHGQPLQLSPIQFTLLWMLALRAGHVLSPAELLEGIWGYQANDSEARELLKVHIRRLRKKMSTISPEGSRYIQAIRGFGYRLAAPTDERKEESPQEET